MKVAICSEMWLEIIDQRPLKQMYNKNIVNRSTLGFNAGKMDYTKKALLCFNDLCNGRGGLLDNDH